MLGAFVLYYLVMVLLIAVLALLLLLAYLIVYPQLPQGGGGVLSGLDAEAVFPEPFAERFADNELIVHHKYADLTFVHSWFPSTEDDIDC